MPSVDKDAEQVKLSCIAADTVKWYGQFRNKFGNFL